ncbi:MAG TPA: nucleotide pyrophosphohydrolase [Bacteroidales bacterium]|nr:nucleotide pyrophosphohydrolase [Bacteroidales bacterium]
MGDIKEIIQKLEEFRDERNWKQFHNPKDLAVALSIEAAELNELFLWKKEESSWNEVENERISEELADVLAYALLLASHYNFDIKGIVLDKIEKNKLKYPVDKSFNTAKKYNKL